MIAAVGDQLTEGPAEYTQAMPEMEVWPLLLEQLKQKVSQLQCPGTSGRH